MLCSTPASTVGCTKKPGSSGAAPPVTTWAPWARALSRWPSTLLCWRRDTSGLICAVGSMPAPMLMPFTAAASASTKSL
ncbi:hypothetical protein D3C75_1238170 [compost metagenome]